MLALEQACFGRLRSHMPTQAWAWHLASESVILSAAKNLNAAGWGVRDVEILRLCLRMKKKHCFTA